MKNWLSIGFLLAGLGVVLGAFGAHGLKDLVQLQERQDSFATGVDYQIYHGVFLVLLGLLQDKITPTFANKIGWTVLIGVLFFSGSIYLLALREPIGLEGIEKKIWWITPLGGILLIISWFLVALKAFKRNGK